MANPRTMQQISLQDKLERVLLNVNVPDGTRITAVVHDKQVSSEDFSVYNTASTKHKELHNILDEPIKYLTEDRKYTKTYRVAIRDLKFSKYSYKGLWFEVINNIYFNSNLLYNRKNNNTLSLIRNKIELLPLVSCSKTVFYKFFNECLDRDYIRVLQHPKWGKLYVVNPVYARIGNGLAESVYNLYKDVIHNKKIVE